MLQNYFLRLIELYKDFLIVEKNFSDNTFKAYIENINRFLNYLQIEEIKIEEIKVEHFRAYFSSLLKKNFSSRSQARHISVFRNFFKFLFNKKITKTNLSINLNSPKFKKNLPKVPNIQELENIFSINKYNNETNTKKIKEIIILRDKCIFEVIYSSGMRISELLSLTIQMVLEIPEQIKITGKGKKDRIVFFGKDSREALKLYIEKRNLLKPKTDNLYINKNGTSLTDRGVRFIISNWCKRLGINKNLSPHKFRHAFASDLMNAGADIRYIQEMLGHASLSTTQIYTHVSKDHLREIYRHCHPHSKN